MPRTATIAVLLALSLALPRGLDGEPLPPPGVPFDPRAPLPPGTVIAPTGPVASGPLPPIGLPAQPGNSVVIPPLDAELVWGNLVDIVDDYFKVQAEQRAVFTDGIPTEGRIDTYPQTGATLLEPWRGDSIGFRERLESTLQSIRRAATVRMIPDPAGWRLEVVVLKELENLPRPMRATAGGASFRNDSSLYRYGTPLPTLGQQVGDQPRPVANPTAAIGWIPIGRDPLLEQRLLARVVGRLGVPVSAGPAVVPPPGVTLGPGPLPGPAPATAAPLPPPVFGAPIAPEQLPPGATIAPGPPVPIETLPVPR
ncbi:MAG: hypothetical protein ACKO9B_15610 [Planctomycetota bacterium]